MNHREKKMSYLLAYAVFHIFNFLTAKTLVASTTENSATTIEDNFDNNIINFEEDFSLKYNKKYGAVPWHSTEKFNKNALRYTVIKNLEEKKDAFKVKEENKKYNETKVTSQDTVSQIVAETTPVIGYGVIPLELISTTDNVLVRLLDSTTEPDLTVIPLSTTKKISDIEIKQTVTLPVSTQSTDITTEYTRPDLIVVPLFTTKKISEIEIKQTVTLPVSTQSTDITTEFTTSTENDDEVITISENHETTTSKREVNTEIVVDYPKYKQDISKFNQTEKIDVTIEGFVDNSTIAGNLAKENSTTVTTVDSSTMDATAEINSKNISLDVTISQTNFTKLEENKSNKTENLTENIKQSVNNDTKLQEVLKTNSSKQTKNLKNHSEDFDSAEFLEDVPVFTELDIEEEEEVPEDYYDAKDVVPTTVPKTDALSVIFGLAGSVVESVVESVAERVVPKGLYDLFKRMQRQNEALEAERLRSREENGGIGQFTRGILKSLSSGLSKPLSQLMAGVKDIGSLDTDRGFVSGLASGVTSVATSVASVADAFKDKVQAIYPGTVWCGDGRSATARSGDLGLFFLTDTCCRQHDACKIFIAAGETKYGLTNTGLFTRSHCSCDAQFRACLRRTGSLVSAQVGLTYFNVLGPQCLRRAHPIVRCLRRTRITGQKCEEYELDYSKPKMWQWFDSETF